MAEETYAVDVNRVEKPKLESELLFAPKDNARSRTINCYQF